MKTRYAVRETVTSATIVALSEALASLPCWDGSVAPVADTSTRRLVRFVVTTELFNP